MSSNTHREEIKDILENHYSDVIYGETGKQLSDGAKEMIHTTAEKLLSKYEETVLHPKIIDEIEKNNKHYLYGVGQSILGSFFFLVIVGLLYLGWVAYSTDFGKVGEKFFQDMQVESTDLGQPASENEVSE